MTGRAVSELPIPTDRTANSPTTKDSVTGLLPRGAFDDDLARLSAEATADAPLALLLCDIDHFKKVNDTFGHPTGDDLLRAVATQLAATVGEAGSCYRYGGEELAVLFRRSCTADAQRIAELFRKRVAVLSIPSRDDEPQKVAVTVSLGISELPALSPSSEKLKEHADSALYRAKEGGRNRTTVFAALGRTSGRIALADTRPSARRADLSAFDQVRDRRLAEILDGAESLPPFSFPLLVLHVGDLRALAHGDDPTRKIEAVSAGDARFLRPIDAEKGTTSWTAEGFLSTARAGGSPSFVQVLRNGVVEVGNTSALEWRPNEPLIEGVELERKILGKVIEILAGLRAAGMSGPFAVGVSLLRVLGYNFFLVTHHGFGTEDVHLPTLLMDSDEDPARALQFTFDLMFQSAGGDRSPSYDRSGTRVEPS